MEITGFFVVGFENVVVVSFVTFTVLGRRTEAKVDGFVGCLVVFDDTLDGIFTVLLVFFNNVASVLGPAAFCTVWNVERRVVCVVISIVVIVGFFVTNFVVSLIVLADVCVLCIFKNADVVYKIMKLFN